VTEHSATLIDNILTNSLENVFSTEVIETGISDHKALAIRLKDVRLQSKPVRLFTQKEFLTEKNIETFKAF